MAGSSKLLRVSQQLVSQRTACAGLRHQGRLAASFFALPPPSTQALLGLRSFSSQPKADRLDFTDSQIAFDSKSTFELFRGWLILQTCAVGWIVRNCDSLYNMSIKILRPYITHEILRYGLFNHFCAGENVKEIIPRMEHLRTYGVGGILDYAAEAKDDGEPIKAPKAEESTAGASLTARNYDYSGEKHCDANALIFMDAIRAVKDATPDGFAAIKLSGLCDPQLMERMSSCLVQITHLFWKISQDPATRKDISKSPYYAIDREFKVDRDTFKTNWLDFFKVEDDADVQKMFDKIDTDKAGVISYLQWTENIRLSGINEMAASCKHKGPMYDAALNDEELQLYFNLVDRVHRILGLAHELGVRVMVDAEWIDIQPAIDHLVLTLQRKYNTGDQPIVFQTYQTYLKGMHQSVLRDLARSQRQGWYFGAKVVRGAYMVSEREKARTRGVESPINDTYEDTEKNYHDTIESILSHNVHNKGSETGRDSEAEVLVASHNRGSIELVIRRAEELGKDKKGIFFGQLMGMADNLTFTLSKNGYKAYKYVPYGPINEVVPYLIRRTQENSAILGSPGVQEERAMLRQELRRRVFRL
mmetsp:Transcript_16576/g.43658  ORF Transcript_16576/g.43658 Transcript_16576/m.43658 type:complete len:589 (-) Transcript_16576:458-2224(-)